MGWNSYFDAPLLQQLIYAQGMPGANVVTTQNVTDTALASGSVVTHDVNVGNALSYQLFVKTTPGTSSAVDLTECDVAVTWYTDATYTTIRDLRYHYLLCQADAGIGSLVLRGPCLTPYMRISHENNDGAAFAMTFSSDLTLFSRELVPWIYRWQQNGALADTTGYLTATGNLINGQPVQINGAMPGSSQFDFYPNFFAGHCMINMYVLNAITTGTTRIILMGIASLNYETVLSLPSGSIASLMLTAEQYLSSEPKRLRIITGTTAPTLRGGITQKYEV